MRPGLLVSDFDGTITRRDFYDLASEHLDLPGIATFWPGYLSGRYSHFEALAGVFASARARDEDWLRLVELATACPGLAVWVERLRQSGWDVTVASAGCHWYIGKILARGGAELEVHANPGTVREGRLLMELDPSSPYFCPRVGIDKSAIVRAGLERGQAVAFAGDGQTDLPAALLVPPGRRFARARLADLLRREGAAFHPFDSWDEVARALCLNPPAPLPAVDGA
jgi:HAD superfamily phosphoserine phosphatase-like hydrolase